MSELTAIGLTADDFEADDSVEVWPDNVAAVNLLIRMGTQWRVGMAGLIGLDYSALPAVLRLSGAPRSDWTGLFDDLQVLEGAALEQVRADQPRDKQ